MSVATGPVAGTHAALVDLLHPVGGVWVVDGGATTVKPPTANPVAVQVRRACNLNPHPGRREIPSASLARKSNPATQTTKVTDHIANVNIVS